MEREPYVDPLGPDQLSDFVKINSGGMATVFRARAKPPICGYEVVAVKLLNREFALQDDYVKRFIEDEVKCQMEIEHANVVRMFGPGHLRPDRHAAEPVIYAIMELVDGVALDELIDEWCRTGPMPRLAKRCALFRGVVVGVAEIHRAVVVHRDVKPENVLVARGADLGTPKVADFGLAKKLETRQSRSHETTLGARMLRGAYTSPEICESLASGDAASDVYSLGVMLLELLWIAPNSPLADERRTALKGVVDAVRDSGAASVLRGHAVAYAPLIDGALSDANARKFKNAQEFLDAFDEIAVPKGTKRWMPWALAASVAVAVILGGFALTARDAPRTLGDSIATGLVDTNVIEDLQRKSAKPAPSRGSERNAKKLVNAPNAVIAIDGGADKADPVFATIDAQGDIIYRPTARLVRACPRGKVAVRLFGNWNLDGLRQIGESLFCHADESVAVPIARLRRTDVLTAGHTYCAVIQAERADTLFPDRTADTIQFRLNLGVRLSTEIIKAGGGNRAQACTASPSSPI